MRHVNFIERAKVAKWYTKTKKLKLEFGRNKQIENAKNANKPSLTSLTILLSFFFCTIFLFATSLTLLTF
jgi:hypothetical protein